MKHVKLMDEIALGRALKRISHEIVENNGGADNLCLIGICNRGVPLARRLLNLIEKAEGVKPLFGVLDIAFYRDDLHSDDLPTENSTDIDFSIDNKNIVLVDDVLYTGRTARAAIDAVMDMGRPNIIRLATIIDRGHRELPISADFVGKCVPTSHTERVYVRLAETDGTDEVVLTDSEQD